MIAKSDFIAISAGKSCDFEIVIGNRQRFVIAIAWVTLIVVTDFKTCSSGKEKAHKHKQIFPVTGRVRGGSPDRVARGLPTGGQGSKVYVLCAEPKEYKYFRPGTRPGGSGTRPTEKLFMCQMFMCLFQLLSGKEKAHKHKLFGPVALGTPRECPRDKPGLSPGQSGFVPGTNPGFLLTLHSGSPVCPWDKPGLSRGHSGDEGRKKEFMC